MAELLERRAMLSAGPSSAAAAAPAAISGLVFQDDNANGVFDEGSGEFGLGGVVVYHDANNDSVYQDGLVQRFAPGNEVPVTIPDEGVVEAQIVIDDLPGVVRDVNVFLDIEHSYTNDLEVSLISPQGTEVLLFNDIGDDVFFNNQNFTFTTLDDEAGQRLRDGEAPWTGSFMPEGLLSDVDGEPMNGTWTLRIADLFPQDQGTLLDWALTFDLGTAEPHAETNFDGTYTIQGLAAGTYRLRQVLFPGYRQSHPTGNAPHMVTVAEGQEVAGIDFGAAAGVPSAAVAGRHVFYNNSVFDGADPAADAQDDAAIAPDKYALRPGEAATFDHYTTYSRGINGLMVDISNLPSGDSLSAADFGFRVGNNEKVWSWEELAAAPAVTIRRGAGTGGSDRVTLTWPDRSVVGQWLQVTVKATGNTGLTSPDVFYFGNLPGDTGDGGGSSAAVNAADVLAVRSNLMRTGRAIDDLYDLTRDGRVNAADYSAARAAAGTSLHLLASAAAVQMNIFSEAPVVARRSAYRPARVWDQVASSVA